MIMDLTHLAEVTGGDREFEKEILEDFLAFADGAVSSLRAALSEGDSEALSRCAHSLKGSARSVGAVALGECSANLEGLAKTAQPPELESAIKSIESGLVAFQTCVAKYLGSEAA